MNTNEKTERQIRHEQRQLRQELREFQKNINKNVDWEGIRRRSVQQRPDPTENNLLNQTSSETEEFNLNKTYRRLKRLHFDTNQNTSESEMSDSEREDEGSHGGGGDGGHRGGGGHRDEEASLEHLVRQIALLHLKKDTPKRQSKGEVLKKATNIIISFDKNNLENFISSVKMALDIIDDLDDKNLVSAVLELAKLRVKNSKKIETTTYRTIEDFRKDLLQAFKPQRTVTEVESLISRLEQGNTETVDQYAKRAYELKTEYEHASGAERAARGFSLDQIRLEEMEKKVADAFTYGLLTRIVSLVKRDCDTLSDAVSAAHTAESQCNLRYRNRQLSSKDPSEPKKKPGEGGKNFRNQRGDKNANSSKPSGSRFTGECDNCHKKGHKARDCFSKKAEPAVEQQEAKPVKTLHATSSKKSKKNDRDESKNGESGGATVSAKSLKINARR